MKKTYLVYKQVNGIKQLVVASQEEWDAILKENRKVPAEKGAADKKLDQNRS